MLFAVHAGLLLYNNTAVGRRSNVGRASTSAQEPGALLRKRHALRLVHMHVGRGLLPVVSTAGAVVLLHGPTAIRRRQRRRRR